MRKRRINPKPLVRRILFNPENRRQQSESRPGGPCLWDIGAEILNWERRRRAIDAGVKLGQLILLEMTCRLADAAGNQRDLSGKAVSLETEGDETVIVRPHGSVLIRIRIVSAVQLRKRANAPTGIHVRRHQTRDHAGGTIRRYDTRP